MFLPVLIQVSANYTYVNPEEVVALRGDNNQTDIVLRNNSSPGLIVQMGVKDVLRILQCAKREQTDCCKPDKQKR